MALSGSSWGTREELLHPRGKDGRFRRKWSLPEGAVDKIMGILDRFAPRAFPSQAQASQWAFNKNARLGAKRFQDYERLGPEFVNTNNDLRAGKVTPSTAKFVKSFDRSSFDLDEDVVLYRKVNPEAFGLNAQNMALEEGGLEDLLTGATIVDKGYTSANVGAPIGNAPITMAIAAPKGTRVMVPGRGPGDPQVLLDRDKRLHVSKVEPDGRGGFNIMAIVTDESGPEEHVVQPSGVTPEATEREAGVQRVADVRGRRMGVRSDEEVAQQEAIRPIEARIGQQELEQQQQQRVARMGPDRPVPQPAGGGPAPRTEPLQSEVLGGRPATPAPTPEAPEQQEDVRIRDFREAFRTANIEVPSSGPRRREFNKAYTDIVNGKRDPEDVLRELEADIRDNQARMDEATTRETPRLEMANIEADVSRQEQLADLIAEQRGLERRVPATVRTPEAGEIPEEGASSGGTDITGMTEAQKDAVVSRVTRLKAENRWNPDNEESQRLQSVVDQVTAEREGREIPAPIQPTTPVKKAVKRAPAKKAAAPVKKAAPAKAAPVKAPEDMTPAERVARLQEVLRGENVPGEEGETDPLDTMTKADLLAEAERRGVGRIPTSWNKTKIKEAIRSGEVKAKAAPPSKVTAAEAAAAGDLDSMTKAGLLDAARGRGVDVKDWWTKDRIKQAIRGEGAPAKAAKKAAPAKAAPTPAAPTPAAPEPVSGPRAVRNRAQDLGLDDPADRRMLDALEAKQRGDDTNLLGNDIGRPLTDVEIGRELDDLGGSQVGPATQARQLMRERAGNLTEADQDQIDKLLARGRAWKRLAARLQGKDETPFINAPAAQKAVSTEDRKTAFRGAFEKAFPDLTPDTAARRSILEVADDVDAGRITPDEGARRLESDIEFNRDELNAIEADIRSTDNPAELRDLRRMRSVLTQDVKAQEKASSTIQRHFRSAPEVTPQEVRQALPEPMQRQLDNATPAELKETARLTGLKEPKGDTREAIQEDLLGQLVEKVKAEAPVKKTAPPKAAPEVKPTAPDKKWQRVDLDALAEGLEITHPDDRKVLDGLQKQLDSEKATPSALGKALQKSGVPGLHAQAQVARGFGEDEQANELDRRALQMESLSERLQKVRRKANTPAAPTPEPEVTPDEKREIAQVAELTGLPTAQLEKRALAKKEADAPAKPVSQQAAGVLDAIDDPQQRRALLSKKLKPELVDIAKAMGIRVLSKDTKPQIIDKIEAKRATKVDTPTLTPAVRTAPMSVRQQAVRDIAAGPTTSGKAPQGAQATTEILTAPDGRRVFRKTFKGSDREAKFHVENEELGSLTMDAVGVPVAATTRHDDRTVDEEFIEGTLGTDIVLNENKPMTGGLPRDLVPQRIRDSDNGRLIGIMDYLTDNVDRNPGNWMEREPGKVGTLDHAAMFVDRDDPYLDKDLRYGLWGEMGGFLAGPNDDDGNPTLRDEVDVSPADLDEIERRITALRPEFESRGRVASYDRMLTLLDDLRPRAKGTRRLLSDTGTPTPAKAVRPLQTPPAARTITAPVPEVGITQPRNAADFLEALNGTDDESAARKLLEKRSKADLQDIMRIGDITPSRGARSTRPELVDDIINNTGVRRPAPAPTLPAAPAKVAKKAAAPRPERARNVTPAQMRAMSDGQLLRLFEDESRKEVTNDERLQFIFDEMGRREQVSAEEAALREVAEAPLYAEVDELVERGMPYQEAYAQVFNLDPQQLEREGMRAQLERIPGESQEQTLRRAFKENIAIKYVQAEAATNGHMLNPAGTAAQIDPMSLFSGPRARAAKYASDELKEWWESNGRPTFDEFKGMMLGGREGRQAVRRARESERGFL